MATDTQVLEGFICPMCMTDFKSPNHLTKHFEEFHNDDPEILKSIKDLFGKAKKKILKQDEIPEVFLGTTNSQKQQLEISREQREPGVIRNHTDCFKKERDEKFNHYISETSKLILRLDNLSRNLPLDPAIRKVHERSIVPWIDETDVKLCPTCAKSFHVARRKHHCRLCGAIMCHNCTVYLSLSHARKLVSLIPTWKDPAASPTSEKTLSKEVVHTKIGITKLARSPSSGSLNNGLALVNDSASAEHHFKICIYCMNILDVKKKQLEKQSHEPIVCQLYENMRLYMKETSELLTTYNQMSESLREGESTYDIQHAQTLHFKIAKLGENIDIVSKRILALGNRDAENPPHRQELRLHQMIRASAMIFLKKQLLSIQSLPSVEEYAALQEERQRRIEIKAAYERRLEEQRQRSKEMHKKETSSPYGESVESGPSTKGNQQQMIMDQSQGWSPSTTTTLMMSCSMNPLVEQMSNVKAYIQQATADSKIDEVITLENHLRELHSAYFALKDSNNTDDSNDG